MSDEEVIDTAPEAEPTTEEAAQDPLFDKLVEGIGAATGTPTDEPEKPAEPEGEKTEEPAKTAAPDDWDDLSDEREWTKERHQKIREQHVADRRRISNLLSKLHDQKTKFRSKVEKFKTEKTQTDLITRRVATDLEALRVGSAEQALDALGRLSQRDPLQLYEGMSLAVLGKGNQPKNDPKLSALEAKLDALIEESKQGRARSTDEASAVQAQRVLRGVMGSHEEWPIIASLAKQHPEQAAQELWEEYLNQSRAAGQWLDAEAVADRIERRLRKSHPLRQGSNGAAPHQGDRDQETRASAKPETAQSPPRSLSPSLSAASGGARREQTEEELQAEFARNPPPGFFENLFG